MEYSFPVCFPRVQRLTLEGGADRLTGQLGPLNKIMFETTLAGWKDIQCIVDKSCVNIITVRLLGITHLKSLTRLVVDCVVQSDISQEQCRERTQALIGCIHNAPSLQCLNFGLNL